MESAVILPCDAFEKNPDGSWKSIRMTDVQVPLGSIRLSPGMSFIRERFFLGVDFVSLLEEQCSK